MAHLVFGRGVTLPLTLAVAAAAFPLAPAYGTDVEPLKAQVKGIVQYLAQDCRHDLETYCSTVTPGEGRLAFCLMAHADKRSEACDIGLTKARQEAEEIVAKSSQACERDIATLCNGTEPGQGRVVQCLLDQRASLSDGCGEVADVVERVVFAASNHPHSADAAAAQVPVEAPADGAGVPPDQPVVEAALSALDAKIAGIVEKGKAGCAADLENYCSSVSPGEGRLVMCLTAHADKRSANCESALKEARTEAENIIGDIARSIEACAQDIASRCAGTEPGEGRIAQCLMEQRDVLSDTCGAVVDRLAKVIFAPRNETVSSEPSSAADASGTPMPEFVPAGQKAAILVTLNTRVQEILEKGKKGCAADLEAFCATVTPGEGRLAMCLVAHADKRSAACESALSDARSEAEKVIEEVNHSINSCSPDMAALCAGTEPGEGRIALCLLENREHLTEACGQVMDGIGKVVFAPRNVPAPDAAASEPSRATAGAVDPLENVREKECRSLEASVTDWGQEATKQDARRLLKSKVGAFAAKRGLQGYSSGGGAVSCIADLDILVAGYYTCRARTQVCWTPVGRVSSDRGTAASSRAR